MLGFAPHINTSIIIRLCPSDKLLMYFKHIPAKFNSFSKLFSFSLF